MPLLAFVYPSPTADPLAFHAHPDTWFVIVLSSFLYWYAIRRLGPRLLGPKAVIATRRQIFCFYMGVLTLEIAGDWPLHDLAENYLYSAHMVQHLLISLVAPPLLLLGCPAWLVRWILRPNWAQGTVRVMCRPVVAGIVFNIVVAISHAPFWVNGTLYHHGYHFWAHLLLFTVAMFMWFPVINKLEEYPSLSGTGRMIYLFLMSVLPNIPAAFLILSTGVVYKFYAHVPHPFPGLNAINDQQLAGAIMKVGGTTYLWGIITIMFFRWVAVQYRSNDRAIDRAASAAAGEAAVKRSRDPAAASVPVLAGPQAFGTTMPKILTWDDVADEFAKAPPPQPEDR